MSKSSISILAKGVAEKCGISQNDAEAFITAMFDVANASLQESKLLKVKWLGTFKVTSIKERESVDVNTGDRILIEGREKIAFTPDNILKEIVNKPFAQFETVIVNDGVDFSTIDEKFSQKGELSTSPILEEPEENPKAEEESEPVEIPESKEEQEPTEHITPMVEPVNISTKESTEDAVIKAPNPESDRIVGQTPDEQIQEEVPIEKVPASDEVSVDEHHIVLPKYLVIAVSVALVILVGGMCWFAFNYGRLAAQRDHLASQLTSIQQMRIQRPKRQQKVQVDKEREELRQKAFEDSVRLAKAHEAIKMAEEAEQSEQSEQEPSKQPQAVEKPKQTDTQFESDPRIRTGAYRIIGVAQTITVKNGETLSSLSKRYLGSGMECYLEAINETKQVKVGQKIKIPKLELKKKLR